MCSSSSCFSKAVLVTLLSRCCQVPARLHGRRVLWEEVMSSESAPEPPSTPLRAAPIQGKSPVCQGLQQRGEELACQPKLREHGGIERKKRQPCIGGLLVPGGVEVESVFTDCSCKCLPSSGSALSQGGIHEQGKELEYLCVLIHSVITVCSSICV